MATSFVRYAKGMVPLPAGIIYRHNFVASTAAANETAKLEKQAATAARRAAWGTGCGGRGRGRGKAAMAAVDDDKWEEFDRQQDQESSDKSDAGEEVEAEEEDEEEVDPAAP